MTDDNTKDLTPSEKLDLILAELADVKTRLARLESFAESRSRDTRPMLEVIHKDLAETRVEFRDRFERIEKQLEVMTLDVMNVRTAQRSIEGRVSDLERPTS